MLADSSLLPIRPTWDFGTSQWQLSGKSTPIRKRAKWAPGKSCPNLFVAQESGSGGPTQKNRSSASGSAYRGEPDSLATVSERRHMTRPGRRVCIAACGLPTEPEDKYHCRSRCLRAYPGDPRVSALRGEQTCFAENRWEQSHLWRCWGTRLRVRTLRAPRNIRNGSASGPAPTADPIATTRPNRAAVDSRRR